MGSGKFLWRCQGEIGPFESFLVQLVDAGIAMADLSQFGLFLLTRRFGMAVSMHMQGFTQQTTQEQAAEQQG